MKYLTPILFILMACQPGLNHGDLPEIPDNNLIYTPETPEIIFEEGSIKGALSANPENGKLSLQLSLINASKEEWVIPYKNAFIITEDDYSTPALSYGINKVIIPPESNQLISFSFSPVNAMPFYRKIDFRGDLRERYAFPVFSIQSASGKRLSNEYLEFTLPLEEYEEYVNNYGKNAGIRIYQFDLDNDSYADFSGDQKPEVRDEEIHFQGVHLRFRLWQISDTLISEWKVSNQAKESVFIDPQKVFIEYSGTTLKALPPVYKEETLALKDGKWEIRPGGKFQYEFRFTPSSGIDKPLLSLSGLFLGEKEQLLIDKSLPFRIDSAFISPNQGLR